MLRVRRFNGHFTTVQKGNGSKFIQKNAEATYCFAAGKKNNLRYLAKSGPVTNSVKIWYIYIDGVLEYPGTPCDSDSLPGTSISKSLFKRWWKTFWLRYKNKYGVKYWCGAGENSHRRSLRRIEPKYKLGGQKTRTFAQGGIDRIIKESGLCRNCFFYYPMPDYKLPTVIYSDQYKPRNENLEKCYSYYIPSDETY